MENVWNNTAIVVILLFVVITFIQSGVDKISDWNGNINWLKEHFEKTPLKNSVPLALSIILLLEIIAGVTGLAGLYDVMVNNNTKIALFSLVVGALALLFLLLGQRLAKDYDGARTIVIYLIPVIFGIYILT